MHRQIEGRTLFSIYPLHLIIHPFSHLLSSNSSLSARDPLAFYRVINSMRSRSSHFNMRALRSFSTASADISCSLHHHHHSLLQVARLSIVVEVVWLSLSLSLLSLHQRVCVYLPSQLRLNTHSSPTVVLISSNCLLRYSRRK